ncbi:MAG: LUD domain-containing protein [Betaproteobacteria bacterium]|nr:LUD domain-containing protein [Betaproteobacteria bacterium]
MMTSRDLILARIRQRRGTTSSPPDNTPLAGTSGQNLHPIDATERIKLFQRQALAMGCQLRPCSSRDMVLPTLQALLNDLPGHSRVAWPQLRRWLESASLGCRFGSAHSTDQIGITGCAGAIAETGSLILTTGPDTPDSVSLLPEIHIALVCHDNIVVDLEAAWKHLAQRADWPPRGVTLVSGPSRTADIEQQVVIGAHGPAQVIILLYPG